MYTQTYNPTVVKKGGGGGASLFWVFAVLQYLGNIQPLVDSLSCDLQDKVNAMGYGAAGRSLTSSNIAAILDFAMKSIHIYRENSKIANSFC